MLSRDSEDKMGCDLCLNLWYDLKRLLWQDELNPRVRCAFGNVSFFSVKAIHFHFGQFGVFVLKNFWSICVEKLFVFSTKVSTFLRQPPTVSSSPHKTFPQKSTISVKFLCKGTVFDAIHYWFSTTLFVTWKSVKLLFAWKMLAEIMSPWHVLYWIAWITTPWYWRPNILDVSKNILKMHWTCTGCFF